MSKRDWDKVEVLSEILGSERMLNEVLGYMSAADMEDCLNKIERYHDIILEKNHMMGLVLKESKEHL